jgi:hypothetical protein
MPYERLGAEVSSMGQTGLNAVSVGFQLPNHPITKFRKPNMMPSRALRHRRAQRQTGL